MLDLIWSLSPHKIWGFSFCQVMRGFLFLASVGFLLAVGYITKFFVAVRQEA